MDEHQRLRRLILGEDLADLDTPAQRLAALEQAREKLPAQLPELLQQSQRGDGRGRLSQALVQPLTDALGKAAQQQRQGVVDALFPVIGPAIRKAIAEAMRDFSEGFNRALESSFTPQGLRWRLESLRTGVPYVQVVLKHNLRFRLDHLFLIDRNSGLVLARESAADLPDLDADAIAGMLTAIGDFVRDSVGGGSDEGGGTLDSASVGEHLVWVEQGPRANLAAFLRGVPPATLRLSLRRRLEQVHAWLGDPLADPAAGPAAGAVMAEPLLKEALDLQRLELDAAAGAAQEQRAPSRRWPLLLALLAVLALLGAWAWKDWQWRQRMDAVAQSLHSWPGLHVDELVRRDGAIVLRGLIDADADSPQAAIAALLPPGTPIHSELRGYVSADDAIVRRRALRQLQPPDSVQLSVRQGELQLRGSAAADWVDQAVPRIAWIAGVARADTGNLNRTVDARAALRAEWERLQAQLPQQRAGFVRELELADAAAVDALVADALRLQELGRQLQQPVIFTCFGHTDEPGTTQTNHRLREIRANWLCDRLAAAGVAETALRRGGADTSGRPTIQARAASLSLEGADRGDQE